MAQPKIQIDIEKAAELARKGLSLEQTALALGVSSKTLQRRRKEVSELSTALSCARAGAEAEVADLLWQLMHDPTAPHIARLKSMIFWLERRGQGWTQAAVERANAARIEAQSVPVVDIKIPVPEEDTPAYLELKAKWRREWEAEKQEEKSNE